MKEEDCRISLVRRLLEQLESLALGVACSSTGRSGQSLQAQRQTEAAGAARVAGGGCMTSYRQGLQEQPSRMPPRVAVAGAREVSEAGLELWVLAAGAAQVTR
jgi:hypothetical protein